MPNPNTLLPLELAQSQYSTNEELTMTKAERDIMLAWKHADRRYSVSDLETDLSDLEAELDNLEDDLTDVRNAMQQLVMLESDLITDNEIAYANRVYAGG